jgi:hypothetical protein
MGMRHASFEHGNGNTWVPSKGHMVMIYVHRCPTMGTSRMAVQPQHYGMLLVI